MPRQWTEAERAAISEKMRAKWVERKAQKSAPPNPIATDVVDPTPIRKPKPRPKPTPPPPPEPETPPDFSVPVLIEQLESIPLGSVSYSDCGLLLNSLSSCSTAVALARRQKQEQLEAGTSRAPCKTCGRMIDISKAGGFQILTERDEHHMPRNSFYCSQNCLLARNMPSHARQTPREKKENRA
jgi:hypothetical protein